MNYTDHVHCDYCGKALDRKGEHSKYDEVSRTMTGYIRHIKTIRFCIECEKRFSKEREEKK